MPLTAQQLYKAGQLKPSSFGDHVDPNADDEEQIEQAIQFIEEEVLELSESEVSVPVSTALKLPDAPLDNDSLLSIFGAVSGKRVIALWNAAQTSYGRSELNKRVNSNNDEYDEDSDQDRIQGNQRLQKLLDFIQQWQRDRTSGTATDNSIPSSGSVSIVSTW